MSPNSVPVAILIGYSTTGKSTLAKAFAEPARAGTIKVLDTDKLISSDHGGHIYTIFLELVQGSNRDAALKYIEDGERSFLTSFSPLKPTLIVAGPNVVIRTPQWSDFCHRVTPLAFYLQIEAAEVYDGLKHRDEAASIEIGDHPALGP